LLINIDRMSSDDARGRPKAPATPAAKLLMPPPPYCGEIAPGRFIHDMS
jgi:hypothetical protein